MSKKGCELCSNPARMFCESDQASLCWDCDEKVHAANFLVAKHTRTLLCHVCHRPTPWKASGPKLGPTVSVCQACADIGENGRVASSSRRGDEDGDDSQESESDDGEFYSDSDDFSDEEEDGENQVVPLSASRCDSTPLTAAASSSTSEGNVSLSSSKRSRGNPYESEDEDECCSSQNLGPKLDTSESRFREPGESSTSSISMLRPLKMRRRSNENVPIPSEQAVRPPPSGTIAIVEKLRRFQQQIEGDDASEMVLGLCTLTRE